ncbi:adenosylmethionine decarboxylase [Uliginosibacterium sp. H1]|uniref:adenosylmethionine decarboxylase n=1 Tax=Uliginosibacterium sp. H1 TaxID=3114757 RepID=UPI002E170498|nr:adenosylmethionine decarboxylase [Uliginosibacterium sp. H1]
MTRATMLGQHILLDLSGVDTTLSCNTTLIERLLRDAADAAGATPIHAHFHPFGEGQGVTGVLLLKESHISIHTWPEHGYAAVDIFMCGTAQAMLAARCITDGLRAAHVCQRNLGRSAEKVQHPA